MIKITRIINDTNLAVGYKIGNLVVLSNSLWEVTNQEAFRIAKDGIIDASIDCITQVTTVKQLTFSQLALAYDIRHELCIYAGNQITLDEWDFVVDALSNIVSPEINRFLQQTKQVNISASS